MYKKVQNRIRRKNKIRAKISGTADRPRLNIFRSNKHIFAQIIDDVLSKTLVSVSDKEMKSKGTKTEIAKKTGEILGYKAGKKNIKTIVFDRNGYKFQGRVKAFAKGAREKGLKF